MSTVTTLAAREDSLLADRFARSAAQKRMGAGLPTADFFDWLGERGKAHHFRVERIPFAGLDGWTFERGTGNLVHRSGKFFSVEGLDVVDETSHSHWQQPVIKQPEVGILGILAKEFDGVLHFLMQAKMEPGNRNLLQLSPTVQATRSNYTKVHRGAGVKYIEYFTEPGRGRVLADVLQSEHGSWFYRKSNRNVIVEALDDVPRDEDFCWLTLGQIGELLHHDNVVNMDSRTVLACAPVTGAGEHALHSDTDLLSWVTTERARHDVSARRIPLAHVEDWVRGGETIEHVQNRYFRVVALGVEADNREVTGWTQPLFEPVDLGITAFLVHRFGGIPHVLVHARVEGGFLDTMELGPTVQCTPVNHDHLPPARRPAFLPLVLGADPSAILYDKVHSEEGGRFLNAESRYLFVRTNESDVPARPPAGYRWVTPDQLRFLVRHGHYLNVQARTLLSVLNSGALEL